MTAKVVYGIIGAILSFFAPIGAFVLWMSIFVGIDLVSGIIAAKHRGEKLESKKLRATIDKLVWYFAAIFLAHGLDTQVLSFVVLYLASMTTGIICGVEFYSVLENAYSITGNRVFWILTQFTNKKIADATGTDIKQEDAKCRKSGKKSTKRVSQ